MKTLKFITLLVCGAVSSLASAQSTYRVQETFHSGSFFDGIVTFSSNHKEILSITGSLRTASNQSAILDVTGIYPGYYVDHTPNVRGAVVMGTGDDFQSAYRLDLAWDYSAGTAIALPRLITEIDPNSGVSYYANSINGTDDAISYTISAVPEPSAGLMLVTGLLALQAARRRRILFKSFRA